MVPKMVRSIALISQTPSVHCLVGSLFLKVDTMAQYLPCDVCRIHHGEADIILTNPDHNCGILNPPNLRVVEF